MPLADGIRLAIWFTEQRPGQCLHSKVLPFSAQICGAVATSLVLGLGKLDKALESAKLLPKLEPAYIPPEVQDENGGLSEECLEVGGCNEDSTHSWPLVRWQDERGVYHASECPTDRSCLISKLKQGAAACSSRTVVLTCLATVDYMYGAYPVNTDFGLFYPAQNHAFHGCSIHGSQIVVKSSIVRGVKGHFLIASTSLLPFRCGQHVVWCAGEGQLSLARHLAMPFLK
jgi:hypothetical protein